MYELWSREAVVKTVEFEFEFEYNIAITLPWSLAFDPVLPSAFGYWSLATNVNKDLIARRRIPKSSPVPSGVRNPGEPETGVYTAGDTPV